MLKSQMGVAKSGLYVLSYSLTPGACPNLIDITIPIMSQVVAQKENPSQNVKNDDAVSSKKAKKWTRTMWKIGKELRIGTSFSTRTCSKIPTSSPGPLQIFQQLPNASGNDNGEFLSRSFFVPPRSVLFINSAWFLSLVLSLICALLATLFQHGSKNISMPSDGTTHLMSAPTFASFSPEAPASSASSAR
ncbi:hypothetical protein EDB92DRAFT_1816390 [Lactarius akahatsu]|uniref:DUF6535 domain-containing protein n=1 Tax=Lactarius akahatsu TaxID=416441 RepID=A0AAD4LL34_9AGAM|nr:hypothetical protein EDB92DRAFT_1816390 [Lactarius akahatsu]